MPYSDSEMEEIGRDPIRLRAWWWHMAMHHKRIARQNREQVRSVGELHPVTNYRPEFEEGETLLNWADISDRVADAILENIDAFVRSTIEPASCAIRALPSAPKAGT